MEGTLEAMTHRPIDLERSLPPPYQVTSYRSTSYPPTTQDKNSMASTNPKPPNAGGAPNLPAPPQTFRGQLCTWAKLPWNIPGLNLLIRLSLFFVIRQLILFEMECSSSLWATFFESSTQVFIFDLASFLLFLLTLGCISEARSEELKPYATWVLTYVAVLGWLSNGYAVYAQHWKIKRCSSITTYVKPIPS